MRVPHSPSLVSMILARAATQNDKNCSITFHQNRIKLFNFIYIFISIICVNGDRLVESQQVATSVNYVIVIFGVLVRCTLVFVKTRESLHANKFHMVV